MSDRDTDHEESQGQEHIHLTALKDSAVCQFGQHGQDPPYAGQDCAAGQDHRVIRYRSGQRHIEQKVLDAKLLLGEGLIEAKPRFLK